jgi:hypothetical protein
MGLTSKHLAYYFYFALKNIKLLCSLNLVKEWASKTWEQALEDVMLLVFKLRSEEKLQCCPRRSTMPYSWEAFDS